MNQLLKVEPVNSGSNYMTDVQLNASSNNYMPVVLPSQLIQSVNGQQMFINSVPQGVNQLFQYNFQNNQQLLQLPVSTFNWFFFLNILYTNHIYVVFKQSTQPQLIQMSNVETFIYQPQVDDTQVIVQSKQPQPMCMFHYTSN